MNLDSYSISAEELASAADNKKVWDLRKIRGQVSTEVATVSLLPLNGAKVHLRAGTSDPIVVHETFLKLYHLPPGEIGEIHTVLDLGANVGLTVAHYAVLFPQARIIGVELDSSTADIATLNTSAWRDRCTIINGAVWTRDEKVNFGRTMGDEYGTRIGGKGDQFEAQGYSIDTLIDKLGVDQVDFVKMDVEGAETKLLTENTGWTQRVKSLLVELHGYPMDKCITDLEAFGFKARKHDRHWVSVWATRM